MKQNFTTLLLAMLLLNACSKEAGPELIDDNGLLTDAGLITEEDPNAPDENLSWAQWGINNSDPIRSLTSEDYRDLMFLNDYLQGKRIVQLGESGHGVKEFNQVKVRMIKYMHEVLGYNVLAFESGLYECYKAETRTIGTPTIQARTIMAQTIFGVWGTEEVAELFEYILATQSTSSPLILTGFDVQVSSFQGITDRSTFMENVIRVFDADYAREVRNFDTDFIAQVTSNPNFSSVLQQRADEYKAHYQALAAYIEANEQALIATYIGDDNDIKVVKQIARYVPYNIDQLLFRGQENTRGSIESRDRGMAENLSFVANELYPNEKIMVWAHNFHIRHMNTQVQGSDGGMRVMGEWLHPEFGDELYTVGIYMYRGQAADNQRNVYDVLPATSGSLESIFYRMRRQYNFLDISSQNPQDGNEWLYIRTPVKSWGVRALEMNLSENYDAILFIDTVSPPDYF